MLFLTGLHVGEQFAPLDGIIDPEMATVHLDNLDVLARTGRATGHVAVRASLPKLRAGMVIVSAPCRRLLLPLPTSRVGIPDAIGEQAIQIGKVRVAVDEEVQALAIVLAQPLAVPRLPPRIVRVEVQAPERNEVRRFAAAAVGHQKLPAAFSGPARGLRRRTTIR